jgi:transcription-repair coupling factor (superfamily II helicase)
LFILLWIIRGIVFVLAISPFIPIISFFQRDKKNPSYGINKDGFLLNERGWNSAFFTWDEIESIKEFDHQKFGKELHFEFVSYTKAINKPNQRKFEQSLSREYGIEKQPKKISAQLVKGDLSAFIDLFSNYFNSQKDKEAVSVESTL